MGTDVQIPAYKLRMSRPEDALLANSWRRARGLATVPAEILPTLGAVAVDLEDEPVAMAWLYHDNSVGVCWPEWLVTRPGGNLAEARRAFEGLMGFFATAAKANGYSHMIARAQSLGIKREAERMGFDTVEVSTWTMFATTQALEDFTNG